MIMRSLRLIICSLRLILYSLRLITCSLRLKLPFCYPPQMATSSLRRLPLSSLMTASPLRRLTLSSLKAASSICSLRLVALFFFGPPPRGVSAPSPRGGGGAYSKGEMFGIL